MLRLNDFGSSLFAIGGLLGIFIFTNRVKGLQCPQYNSSLVIDISLLNCLFKMTDINLFTGCVVCNGFYKLKSMTYVIYVYVLFSYIQHGREVVVNINIDFRFYVCFQTKPKSFVSYIQSVGDPKSLDFKFYSAIHRQCLKLGRLLNLSLLKMKNGCSFFYKGME